MLRTLHATIVMVIMPIDAIPSTHIGPSSIVTNGVRKAPVQKDHIKQGVGRSAVRRVGEQVAANGKPIVADDPTGVRKASTLKDQSQQGLASSAVRRVGVQVTANGKSSVADEVVTHEEVAAETKEEPQSQCSPEESDFHLVFSTGCSAYQHWQAEVLLNSAYHVGQCGKVTRIVAGCDTGTVGRETDATTHPDSKSATRKIGDDELMRSTFPNLLVHHAPSIPLA
jgi:hypothetical protein